MTDTSPRLTPRALLLAALAVLSACGGGESDTGAAREADTAVATVAPTVGAQAEAPAAPAATPAAGPHGKYGCIETVSRMINGSFEFETEQRGFITLTNGRYTDPYQVAGTYRHDAATDSTFFTGGALDGANATPMEDQRLRVVIPVAEGRENRWTCGPA